MALIPLKFRPGLVRDLTDYSGGGGWYDCDKVRFRMGLPEKMGGWEIKIDEQFLGICRAMMSWSLLSGISYLALGTNVKFYVSDGTAYTDVTPIRLETTLGADPFEVTNGETAMLVTDVANGATVGDYVTFSGAFGFANITADDLNREFEIISVTDADTYTVTLSHSANATTAGGGVAVEAAYQINVGFASSVIGYGWGAGGWGRGGWGSAATVGLVIELRIWSIDTFGQDLIACIRNGGVYHWDGANPTARMVALTDIIGESDAPVVASAVLVSSSENHTIAFGANPLGETDQDPMLVRWSDTETYLDWTPTAVNTAGGYRLSIGTRIVAVQHARTQILIWTDLALYTMTWTGAPYVFNFQLVGYNVSVVGPNAATILNDVTFWMGENQFYMYDGRIQVMPCPITDYIFTNMTTEQIQKVYAYTNSMFNEVGWLYPHDEECDSYVIYNIKEQAWYFGTIARTAWFDLGASYLPLATSDDSYLFNQEFGFDDGSTDPVSPIEAFIESSPLETSEEGPGDHFLFMDRIIPDITFRNSTADEPSVTMTLETRDYPGGVISQEQASPVTQTASVPVTQFTNQCFVRLRGRSAIFRCESTDVGVTWRLGGPRVSYRIDGRR